MGPAIRAAARGGCAQDGSICAIRRTSGTEGRSDRPCFGSRNPRVLALGVHKDLIKTLSLQMGVLVDTLSKVEAMVARQVKSWELSQRAAGADTGYQEGPWITVSRQLGSAGSELTGRLADELGWEVFDRQILKTIAEHAHTREAIVSHLDERAIGPLIDYIRRLLDPEVPGQTGFLHEMLRVIWGLAKQGNAIIVGRGANWFLDPCFGLRVRMVAPIEIRTERIVERENLSRENAEMRIRENDERQSNYVRKIFGRDIDDPLGYDLMVNTGSMDGESTARTVMTALLRRVPTAAKTGGSGLEPGTSEVVT